MSTERKFAVGIAGRFDWRTPGPVAAAPAPVLSIYTSAGTVAPTFSVLRAAISPATISADRRVLTAASFVSVTGQAGPLGAAFLRTAESGVFPVRVIACDVSGSTVTLAEPLPRSVDVVGSSLQWATYTATLSASTVTNVKARNMRWSVTYTTSEGTDVASSASRATGLLHVVYQPFDTGLDQAELLGFLPDLGGGTLKWQAGWGPQIEAAHDRLVNRIRADLAERELYEDDIHDPSRLRVAHAYLVAAMHHEGKNQGLAESMYTMFARTYEEAMRVVALDLDGDGTVNDGEGASQVRGGRAADVGGMFAALDTTLYPAFARRQNH